MLKEILVHNGNIHQVHFSDDMASNERERERERERKRKLTGILL